ncbi:major facilitator superfamily domain-containing protein [Diplogelasinospora grovesii]|uniref:Major facilitator superfamily domain-containing protein n=1 Tax=Diplogelasinospora grovesii TaxID=303347 RepID=A0AAN6N3N3_9PEZI|nr:major facilitator superfamily domain-containing protein [Diplogelasinospora grovesii]
MPTTKDEILLVDERRDVDTAGSLESVGPERRIAGLVQETPKSTWKSHLWDTLDKSPEERRFLFKLDAALLTFASLGYFIKYLDQININNAFVSGMKEDLKLFGNELNYIQTCWTVGYVIGEIPSNMLLTRVRPSIWIPACEVTWSVLTILLSKCSNVTQVYVLRFFIGLAESAFYPGMQYIIGSWYRKDELAKRSCIFHASGAVGTMFSGYLMAAVYNLGGVSGFKGWQWLFIIDTVISLPIAIAGFFLLPDLPEISRAWYLSKDDIAMAQRRMALEGRANRAPYTIGKLKHIFSSWHIYALSALYIFFNNGNGATSQPAFQLWLKSEGYSVTAINSYPTITAGITVITTLLYAWTSDSIFRGARWPPIVFSGFINIIVYSSLAAWDIPNGWRWACYLLAGFGGGISGLTFAWAHEICKDDNEERAIVTGSMNEMAYVVQAWLPLLIWQQVEAPQYRKAVIGAGISGVCTAGHLLRCGAIVTVFERSGLAGGVWHYDERISADPDYPSETPSRGDYDISAPGQFTETTPPPEPEDGWESHSVSDPALLNSKLETSFSPPGPCYAGLKNNVPTSLMVTRTEENTTHDVIEKYVHGLAQKNGVDSVTLWHTRVDEARKSSDGKHWIIRTVTLDKTKKISWLFERYWEFDAVVVASGHYNLPRIPDIEGLKELKARSPDSVIHSKQYRTPEKYRGQNLLLIGAGTSSVDIARELHGVANKTYQSVRGGEFDLPASFLPPSAERVAEVDCFSTEQQRQLSLPKGAPVLGTIKLKDGRILEDVQHVIISTGYITSYPFLAHLHDDTTDATEAGPEILVTSDGNMAHNLHKDIFYIPDPTLAFVGVPYHTATFSLFDFQAQVVARVYTGGATLPSQQDMRRDLRATGQEVVYVEELVNWMNEHAECRGVEPMKGHTDHWKMEHDELKERIKNLWGN